MMTLKEVATELVNPHARRTLAMILGVPVARITDEMVRSYINANAFPAPPAAAVSAPETAD
jgi:hypothetical protein